MMNEKMRTPEEIEEMIRLYYKPGRRLQDWDEFDKILLHLTVL